MLSFLLATSALLAPHQASRTRVASIAMSDVEKTTGPDVSLAASQAKAELRADFPRSSAIGTKIFFLGTSAARPLEALMLLFRLLNTIL